MSDVIVAPFSNSDMRDWPIAHYAECVRLLLARWTGGGTIHVVGTANQKLAACGIVRQAPTARVVNQCGRWSWDRVLGEIERAACVIVNNSGIAHIAAGLGVPTVCVFGGAHDRNEWRPLGRNMIVVTRAIGCSPCQLDHGQSSWYGKACLRQIEPATVVEAAMAAMARDRREAA